MTLFRRFFTKPLFSCVAISLSFAAQANSLASFSARLSPAIATSDAKGGWGERRPGKFIDSSEQVVAHAEVDAIFRLSDTLHLESALSANSATFGEKVGFTELFMQWRPVPKSSVRHGVRAGFFYPPISLENSDVGWQSPFTNSFSAINTWVAEEVRVAGIEISHQAQFNFLDISTKLKLSYAPFVGNDPAGALLAWKGWSVHDRQSVYGDRLPLLDLPLFNDGQEFEQQGTYSRPFKEVDNRVGYYVGADWALNGHALLRALYYDNRAKPTRIEDGQYGWRTRFSSLGLTCEKQSYDFVFQILRGSTQMGPKVLTRYAVDNQFTSAFFLVSKSFDSHRFSFRQEWFDVKDRDFLSLDPNSEDGYATTLAYQKRLSGRLAIHVEAVAIRSKRPSWALLGVDPNQRETQFSLGLTFQLGQKTG